MGLASPSKNSKPRKAKVTLQPYSNITNNYSILGVPNHYIFSQI